MSDQTEIEKRAKDAIANRYCLPSTGLDFADAYLEQLQKSQQLERKLEMAVAALKLVDKSWFDPKEGEFACLACDMNQGNANDHDSWCCLQKAHEALKEIEGMK